MDNLPRICPQIGIIGQKGDLPLACVSMCTHMCAHVSARRHMGTCVHAHVDNRAVGGLAPYFDDWWTWLRHVSSSKQVLNPLQHLHNLTFTSIIGPMFLEVDLIIDLILTCDLDYWHSISIIGLILRPKSIIDVNNLKPTILGPWPMIHLPTSDPHSSFAWGWGLMLDGGVDHWTPTLENWFI